MYESKLRKLLITAKTPVQTSQARREQKNQKIAKESEVTKQRLSQLLGFADHRQDVVLETPTKKTQRSEKSLK